MSGLGPIPGTRFDGSKAACSICAKKFSDYPLIEVGVHTLNRNPENFFAQIEQAAFSPANTVPGIDISPDKMLMARVFSYPDAQRYRVGSNYAELPAKPGS